MVNHAWKSVDTILEDVSVTEKNVWCQTITLKTVILLTRFKVAPNMADPISLN